MTGSRENRNPLAIMVVESGSHTKLVETLAQAGYDVVAVDDERPARLLRVFVTEIVVIVSPAGAAICRELREAGSEHGILIITTGASAADRIAALEAGADDCLAVPFDRRELLARVDAIRRRTRQPAHSGRVSDLVGRSE